MYFLITYNQSYITQHYTSQRFSVLLCHVLILEMLQTLIIHSNVYRFYVIVNILVYNCSLLPFVDEVCRKLVAQLLCCLC